MTGQSQDPPEPTRPSTRRSQSDAYLRFRNGLSRASHTDIPGLDPVVVVGTIAALAAAIGLAFAPWLIYTRDDGTTGSTNAIRSEGPVLVIAAIVAIVALVIAVRSDPGDQHFPALVGFCACVVSLIVTGYTLMDPTGIFIDEPEVPAVISRAWGLYGAFLMILAATAGSFILWRTADHF